MTVQTPPTTAPPGRVLPRTTEEAHADLPTRRAELLRAWGMSWRHKQREDVPLGELPPWDDESPTALRMIAAGMAVLSDGSPAFGPDDWALFSGIDPGSPLADHRARFREVVLAYFREVFAYTEVGTEGPGKLKDASGGSGDYDFPLRDLVAMIHLFVDEPDVLDNDMIFELVQHQAVEFIPSGTGWDVVGQVPFAGQDLDQWLAAGPGGRHYFHLELPVVSDFPLDLILPTPSFKMSTPETENHLLGIYAWRFLLNDYLTFVHRLQPGDDRAHRADDRLVALVDSDPGRYVNGPEIVDFVLQLLGRIPHSGMYESNAKPYGAYAIAPILAFYQAADRLFPDDPDRQRIKVAAHNALDYLAAEFAVQSLEGKRVAPFRRNNSHQDEVSFYASDYAPHIWGVLTGAYVFPDGAEGPFHWERIGQEGGFALWAVLSGYQVPRAVHDLMVNKHGGYAARVQTRYSKTGYPLEVTVGPGGPGPIGDPPDPRFARPRYFPPAGSPTEGWDVPGPGEFVPATQLYFATADYLNSAGGHNLAYYFEIEIPMVVVDLLIAGTVGLPPIPGLRDLVQDFLNDAINGTGFVQKIRGSDVISRPSTLILRGDLQPDGSIGSLEATLPAMRGQDDFWASKNLSTYKSFGLGYTFRPGGHDRHLVWPQRYPAAWDEHLAERFGIGRAAFQVFDFVDRPEHPLAGSYWVIARFSKSHNRGQFREYGRGLWEVVPGHQYPDAAALAARIKELNPGAHFDDDEDHHYAYRLATTAETVVIHNRFGSTATDQAILELRSAAGETIPLNRYLADMRDREGLRQLPLLDAWQVDRNHDFTGLKYAHADGRGRVVLHNPFVGQTIRIDSSDHRAPTRSVDDGGVTGLDLPPMRGTGNLLPVTSGLVSGAPLLHAIRYFFEEGHITPSPHPGELLVLDPTTLAVLHRTPVGRSPRGIAVHRDTGTVHVVNYDDVSLSIVDNGGSGPVTTLPFDGFGIQDVAVSRTHHRVFIPQPGQQRVLVVDGATRTVLPPMTGIPVVGTLALDQATDRLFLSVTNATDPLKIDIVEYAVGAGGQQELGRVTIDRQVSRAPAMAVDPAYCSVLAFGPVPGGGIGQKLVLIDRRTRQVAREVGLPTGGALAVASSASQHVACVSTLNGVQLIDTRTGARLRKLDYGGQILGSVEMDEATGTAWFAGSHSRHLRTWTRAFDMGE